jgi:hypothetical protein
MQWEYPWVLAGLLAVPGLAYLFGMLRRQKTAFREAWSQLPYTRARSMPPAAARHHLGTALFLSGFALSVVGFASPMLQRTAWEPFWENVALVVMMDFSRSMEAPRDPDELNAPSRFVETRQNLLGFLSNLPTGVKVSFVPFSEYAIPITSGFSDDHGELVAKVRRLQRDFFYKQGTDLALALQEGFNLADAFMQLHADNGAGRPPVTSIILISDGDEPVSDDLRKAVNERTGSPVPVFAIGIGSVTPAYIPDDESPVGYLLDDQQQPVTTALNTETLRFIADKTGGAYHTFAERGELVAALQDIIREQGVRSQRSYTYPFPLRGFLFFAAFVALVAAWRVGEWQP